MDRSGFWFGVAEALLVPLVFAALGLGWWGALPRAEAASASYPRGVSPPAETWLVDGFNVVQVALLGGRDRSAWWSGPQRAELLARAEGFEERGATLFVVFDGERAAPGESPGRVRPVFAPSADDWLVTRVREAAQPERLVVVTADRKLAARVRHHGARVVAPGEFLDRCAPKSVSSEWGEAATI